MGRGILTTSDKKWLRGEKEYNSKQSDSNKRKTIRDRVFQALLDFELLASELSDADRQKIFERLSDESDSHGVDESAAVIEFLYKGLSDLTTDPNHIAAGPKETSVERFLAFRNALTSGVERGKSEYTNPQEEPPDIVTVASNAYLFEFPDDDDVRAELETERLREINNQSPGDHGNHDDVAFFLQAMIQRQIHERISARHQAAKKDLKDYNDFEGDTVDMS
ncbi:hypothetical protein [Halapricum hydrolyticum]|jgi:hypothetical protein|uniref:Domain of unknown function domain-containing protein n=1 Tax=Halapricum hydrolyticum TaxID=2979991 RepID=A0AAE3IGD5_9EURY|nr:hypothetical protein [Halapricum hydrolyticum]MCU4719078.1 hypothetical protein [Halapricum hydrolyticum]MCU4728149.1 hypothetical protein [Halapricum hydrolyticum]